MVNRSSAFVYGMCGLCLLALCSVQIASAVECFVCPNNKLSNCVQPLGSEAKVVYEMMNCTACGKLVSWNPSLPTKKNYVGLRKTVRSLEYRYCATNEWIGCYKSESAITTSIECVCESDKCNSGERHAAGPWLLTASLLLAARAVAAL